MYLSISYFNICVNREEIWIETASGVMNFHTHADSQTSLSDINPVLVRTKIQHTLIIKKEKELQWYKRVKKILYILADTLGSTGISLSG